MIDWKIDSSMMAMTIQQQVLSARFLLIAITIITIIVATYFWNMKTLHIRYRLIPKTSLSTIRVANSNTKDLLDEYRSSLEKVNSTKDLENLYYEQITQNSFICGQSKRVGQGGDGGWNLCVTKEFKLGSPCYMYSFGINNIWEFDDAISKDYKCEVRAFDPSMNIGSHKRNPKLWFFNYGLGGKDETRSNGWKMFTYESLLKKFNHSNTVIDILKFDVEYSEWESMEHMVKSGVLKNVKQLMLETHTDEVFVLKKRTTSKNYRRYIMLWKQLNALGFRQWHNHLNPAGMYVSQNTGIKRTCCYEHYLVNTKFL